MRPTRSDPTWMSAMVLVHVPPNLDHWATDHCGYMCRSCAFHLWHTYGSRYMSPPLASHLILSHTWRPFPLYNPRFPNPCYIFLLKSLHRLCCTMAAAKMSAHATEQSSVASHSSLAATDARASMPITTQLLANLLQSNSR